MEIRNQKDLARLFALCRKHGVESLAVGNISLKLGDKPERKSRQLAATDAGPSVPSSDPLNLSPEDLAVWSSGGMPVTAEG